MSSSYERYPRPTPADYKPHKEEETIDRFFDRPMKRRNAIAFGLTALSMLKMGLAADTDYAREHYPQHALSIDIVRSALDKEHDRDATIFIPPFNFLSAAPFAEAVQDTVANFGHVAALTHDTNGFSIDDCADKINIFTQQNNIENLTLCGSSIGGLISTVLATRIPKVNHLIVDSSPSSIGDIKDLPDFLPVNLSAALDRMNLTGGPVIRGTFEFIKRVNDGDKSLDACLTEAVAKMSPEECPNGVDIDLFLFLWTHDALAQQERFKRSIDIDYLGADNANRDTLVNQTTAIEVYKELAEGIGGTFSHYTSRETGHTDIPHHPKPYQRMFQSALQNWHDRQPSHAVGSVVAKQLKPGEN